MKRTNILLVLSLLLSVVAMSQPQYELAKQYLKEKKFKEAAAMFRGQLQSNQRDMQTWLQLAKAYLGNGQADSAEIAAARARQLDDEQPEAYCVLSQAQFEQNHTADAHATLRKGLKLKKDVTVLWMQLAKIQFAMDSTDQALVSYTRARESNPNLAAAYEGIGDCYKKQGILPLAIGQYEKSIEVDSLQPELLYKLAQAHLKERRYTDAAKVYQRLVNNDPTKLSVRKELGDLYFRAKQYANAARAYKEFVDKNPTDNETKWKYVDCLFLSKQYKEVIPVAEPMYKADPQNTKLVRYLATSFAAATGADKKPEKTIEFYTKLEQIDTLRAEDYRWWGFAYSELKKDTMAAITWEKSVALDTTQSFLYGNIGSIWMGKQKYARAAEFLKKRFLLDTTAIGSIQNYGICLFMMKDFNGAIESFSRVVKQSPKYPPAYSYLGSTYNQMERFADARASFEGAIKAIDTAKFKYKNELMDAYKGLALAYILDKPAEGGTKNWSDAVPYLVLALKLNDNDIQTNILLAQAYQTLQKKAEAIKLYKKVLKLDPKNEAAKKGLEALGAK